MPYKQDYNKNTVKKGGSRTPDKVMGSQGTSANITPSFNKAKPTMRKPFPQ